MAGVACAVGAQPLGVCLAHVLSSSPSAIAALVADTSKVKKGVFWNFPLYIDVIQRQVRVSRGQGQGPRRRLLQDGLSEIHILKRQCPVSQNVIGFDPRALEEVIKSTEDQKGEQQPDMTGIFM